MRGPAAQPGFVPLFLAQALGALNDNLAKTALAMLVVYGGSGRAWLVPLAGGAFVLPYAVLGAQAGALADRMGKARLLRLTKLAEIALMAAIALGLALRAELPLLLLLLGLGVQATLFGPVKYGILPELLPDTALLAGNGLIEAGTFAAILAGTMLGTLLAPRPGGLAVCGGLLLAAALGGYAAARRVPDLPPASPGLALDWRPAALLHLLEEARARPAVWHSACAISLFWGIGIAFLSEFPVLAARNLGARGGVVTLMLVGFTLGVGAGSLLAGRLARKRSAAVIASAGLLGMAACTLTFAALTWRAAPGWGLHTAAAMLRRGPGQAMLASLVLAAGCGGAYSVPLYARLQHAAPADARARAIAANNVLNAVAMVAATGLLAALAALGLAAPALLAVFGLGSAAMAPWAATRPGLRQSTLA